MLAGNEPTDGMTRSATTARITFGRVVGKSGETRRPNDQFEQQRDRAWERAKRG